MELGLARSLKALCSVAILNVQVSDTTDGGHSYAAKYILIIGAEGADEAESGEKAEK